jgi:hypothetical protein
MKRWVDSQDAESERARRLISDLPPAATLSPSAHVRIKAALGRAAAPRPRGWRIAALAAPALALVAITLLVRHGVTPQAPLASPPAETSVSDGRYTIAATDRAVTVRTAKARITVAAGHSATIEVVASRVIIAGGAEHTTIEWLDQPLAVPAALAEESRLLAAALQQLHAGDPVAALAAIADYDARFPEGTLRPEARRLETACRRATSKAPVERP